jgi:hypothetical protein
MAVLPVPRWAIHGDLALQDLRIHEMQPVQEQGVGSTIAKGASGVKTKDEGMFLPGAAAEHDFSSSTFLAFPFSRELVFSFGNLSVCQLRHFSGGIWATCPRSPPEEPIYPPLFRPDSRLLLRPTVWGVC